MGLKFACQIVICGFDKTRTTNSKRLSLLVIKSWTRKKKAKKLKKNNNILFAINILERL